MAMSCFVCEQRRSEDAQEILSDVSQEDEDHLKNCFDAIGKADGEVFTQLSLCSHHFSQACSIGLILMDNAVPTLEMAPTSSDSIAKAAEVIVKDERSSPQRESDSEQSSSPLSRFPIKRPVITRGRRTRMLPQEEVEVQPFKHVRYLKSVNWDEISKVPGEAKIVWEVAMEELKENNDKIKHLQAQVHQLSAIVQKLKNELKTQKERETTANDFS